MANLTKPFTKGAYKFNPDTFLITAEDNTVICSLSPKLPNTRGVMTQTANGYLLAQAGVMYKALTAYVESEEMQIKKYKFKGIPHKPSEQYELAKKALKAAKNEV